MVPPAAVVDRVIMVAEAPFLVEAVAVAARLRRGVVAILLVAAAAVTPKGEDAVVAVMLLLAAAVDILLVPVGAAAAAAATRQVVPLKPHALEVVAAVVAVPVVLVPQDQLVLTLV